MNVQLKDGELLLLGRCALFQGVDEPLLCRILGYEGVEVVSFDRGDPPYQPDRFQRCLGVLLSGQVRVTNGPLSISILEPGQLFGAATLYNDGDYSPTLTPLSLCRALLLSQTLVDRLLGEEPLLRANYLSYLTGRIRFLTGRIQSLAQTGAEGKLARYLLSNHVEGALQCSATDLAKRLGISRASLYRAFELLEADQLIRRDGKRILIPNAAALEAALP